MINDITLIVSSCDKYERIWKPFFTIFKKYWPDCPFEVYLFSETKSYPGIKGLTENISCWATRLKKLLKKIDTPYVLLMLEDFLLITSPDNKRILELFEIQKREGIKRLGLTPFLHVVGFNQFKNYPDLIQVGSDPYRINFQAGIWEKKTLENILVEGETIWQTETKGTQRSKEISPLTMMKDEWVIKYQFAIERGKIRKDGSEYLKKEGFNFDAGTEI